MEAWESTLILRERSGRLGLGIDTGGTCTDAVVYDLETKRVLSAGKALTTKENLEIGIANALDTLDQGLLSRVETAALSTTLATNACVENKGARAKLLMIGFEESMMYRLKETYASYGLTELSEFVILEAKPENLFRDAFDPDWKELEERAEEYFADCDAIGIVQMYPRANGHRFELTAREILEKRLPHPITISMDIAKETDILKTCAGTLLNARLIPLIEEFMEAVHAVLEKRGLRVPISIVRSDGTLMSEAMAKTCPVETLLSGPAASVIGSQALAGEPESVIVDMGGTTTDIALSRAGRPVMADRGVQIGQWTTMVRGIYVSTCCLGGDTAVRFRDGELFLDEVRVIPLSILAEQYDYVLPELTALAENPRVHGRWIHEYYVLLKDITGKRGYTEEEREICEALKERPLITMELARRVGRDPYLIRTERLESDGVLIKAGLTPTDIMILKGDFGGHDARAAGAALDAIAINLTMEREAIPERVYEMVVERLYRSIARVLITREFPKRRFSEESLALLLDCFFESASKECSPGFADLGLSTKLRLVGVGAPTHVFLPRAARLLGAQVKIPDFAGVANAVGAISGRMVSRAEAVVKPIYHFGVIEGYRVVLEGESVVYAKYEDAEDFAGKAARRLLGKKMRLQGMEERASAIRVTPRQETVGAGILYQTVVEAVAECEENA